jgi:hypothetical protein
MSVLPTTFTKVVNEGSTAIYTAVLQDQDGVIIPLADISTLTISLCTLDGTEINGRTDQNALNANGVTVDALGNLTFVLEPADTAIIFPASTNVFEIHRATFKVVYSGGFSNWDVDINVRNLLHVT